MFVSRIGVGVFVPFLTTAKTKYTKKNKKLNTQRHYSKAIFILLVFINIESVKSNICCFFFYRDKVFLLESSKSGERVYMRSAKFVVSSVGAFS